MKLICDGEDLANALSIVSRASSAKSLNPVLEGIKLTAKDGTLTLAATDLEMYIQKTIRADIETEGATVVPGKLFCDYVGRLNGTIGLHLNGDNMQVTHGENIGNFQCMLLVEYPDIVNINKKPHFYIKSESLRDFITKTRVSVSTDDTRMILKGVLFEVGKDKITGVALDGFRLSKVEKTIKNDGDAIKIVVPAKSLDEIKKIVGDDNGEVGVVIDNKFFQVCVNKTTIAARLLDGEFINYSQVIPTNFITNAIIEKAAFEKSVERAGLLMRNDKINIVTLNIADKVTTITSNNEVGKIAEKVHSSLTGKDIKISFNARYLFDVLKAITSEFISINCSGELSPCTITSAKESDYLLLVLPVRV